MTYRLTYRHRAGIGMIELVDLSDRARLPCRFHARRASAVLPG